MKLTKILLLTLSVNLLIASDSESSESDFKIASETIENLKTDEKYTIDGNSEFVAIKKAMVVENKEQEDEREVVISTSYFYISTVEFEENNLGQAKITFSKADLLNSEASNKDKSKLSKQNLPDDGKNALDNVLLMYCTSATQNFSHEYFKYIRENFQNEDWEKNHNLEEIKKITKDSSKAIYGVSVACQKRAIANNFVLVATEAASTLKKENEPTRTDLLNLVKLLVNTQCQEACSGEEDCVCSEDGSDGEKEGKSRKICLTRKKKLGDKNNVIIALSVVIGLFCVTSIGFLAILLCRRRDE